MNSDVLEYELVDISFGLSGNFVGMVCGSMGYFETMSDGWVVYNCLEGNTEPRSGESNRVRSARICDRRGTSAWRAVHIVNSAAIV